MTNKGKYKCNECNKMIAKIKGQWWSNFYRFRRAGICRPCYYDEICNNNSVKCSGKKKSYYTRRIYPIGLF